MNQSKSACTAFKSLFVLALAIGLAACASGPEIRVDGDPNVNITAYRSFGFFSSVATDKAGYSTILTTRLKDATRRELEKRGYAYTDSNPELLVNFNLNVVDKTEIYSTPGSPGYGYYGYRSGYYGTWGGYETQITQYTEGTLTVDVVDAARKQLAWDGTAIGRVREEARKNLQPAIDKVMTQIFEKFPSRNPPAP